MARILIVDDNPDQALLVSSLLGAAEHTTEMAGDGEAALRALSHRPPDLVVTDLVMPGMSGLELVEAIVAARPALPVVLMTAFGSGEIAMQALRRGAASYVPKRCLESQIVDTVESVLELTQAQSERKRLLQFLDRSKFHFILDNDSSLVAPLVSFVQDTIVACSRHAASETEMMQVGLALQEALNNAIHHGNLEVSSEIRNRSFREYQQAIEQRRRHADYRERRVHLRLEIHGPRLQFVIRDDGHGFDIRSVPNPTNPDTLLQVHGRGLYLIGSFMNEVRHNETGNEITLTKHLGDEADDR